jgi:flavin reductase (DIM6/NTAB) family NADH-FMN oxidoreductase RutF
MSKLMKRRDALTLAAASLAGSAMIASSPGSAQTPARAQGSRPKPPSQSGLPPAVEAAKKNAFIMIPYGMFILGVKDGEQLYAGAINWVSQIAYKEPLFTMGVRRPGEFGFPYDDALYAALVKTGKFSLSFLGASQADIARAFLKPVTVEGDIINGNKFHTATTGAPIIDAAPAWFEGSVEEELVVGDHSVFVARVTNAGNTAEQTLLMDRDATRRPSAWLKEEPA